METSKEFCALFMSAPPIKKVRVQVIDQNSETWREVPVKVLPMSRFEAKQRQMTSFMQNYLKNIEASNALLIQIQKGLTDGAKYEELFILACDCISAMRGDDQLKRQTDREIKIRKEKEQ